MTSRDASSRGWVVWAGKALPSLPSQRQLVVAVSIGNGHCSPLLTSLCPAPVGSPRPLGDRPPPRPDPRLAPVASLLHSPNVHFMPEASFNLSHTWVFPRFTAPGPFHDTADDDDDDASMPAGTEPSRSGRRYRESSSRCNACDPHSHRVGGSQR